jgi:CRISPR system Cascade subunit CasC
MREASEQRSAGTFDTELASGFGYVVVDVPQLIANLEGTKAEWSTLPTERRELTARVVQHLVHSIATVSPGAKRGSTAPFEWAKFKKLSEEIGKLDVAYGAPIQRRYLALDDVAVPNARRLPLSALADWVQDCISQGSRE